MKPQRTDRLNSLLREVISDVIRTQVKDPRVAELTTVTRVEITRDLRYAKVFVSIIGDDTVKAETMQTLKSASGFIAVNASKLVVMRHFPELTFKLDDSADRHMRIEELLGEIQEERENRIEADEA